MKAGSFLCPINALHLSRLPSCSLFIRASSNSQENGKVGYRGGKQRRRMREWVANQVSKNDDGVRSLPIYTGGVSLLAVLFNRTVSGLALVADASSSQSRADLLTLGLAVTNILTGLVWLSIRPKTISVVNPVGVECLRISSHVTNTLASELLWAWESLSVATCGRSLVIIYEKKCIFQAGIAASSSSNDKEAVSINVHNLTQGSLYQSALKSGSQSYLANLSLYPGKSELPFLPENMQAVILQPLGDKGIAIIGGDIIRGFTTSDQAWISFLGEKLDTSLSKFVNAPPVAMQNTG